MNTPTRHILSFVILLAGVAFFASLRSEMHPVHQLNRAFADSAFLMLCLTLSIGPAARFWRGLNSLMPLRRELGLWLTAAAAAHVLIYALIAYEGDFLRFFTETTPHHESALLRSSAAIANWIGAVALMYLIILAITSNDTAMRLLGKGWKFLQQQQSYTLLVLSILHISIFVVLVYTEQFSAISGILWVAAAVALGLQIAGFFRTVALARSHPHRQDVE
jgi:DMSO/TMAO reductase YedYZ heme-binding membrane subunit